MRGNKIAIATKTIATKTIVLGLLVGLTGCGASLEGVWEGDLECAGRDYTVEAEFIEGPRFEYSGDMIFEYTDDRVINGQDAEFYAQFKYEFDAIQTAVSGAQDIFLEMTWTNLYCEIRWDGGDDEAGGCQNIGGIDSSDKDESAGYVEMRFSGIDRLSVSDDNCDGDLFWLGK